MLRSPVSAKLSCFMWRPELLRWLVPCTTLQKEERLFSFGPAQALRLSKEKFLVGELNSSNSNKSRSISWQYLYVVYMINEGSFVGMSNTTTRCVIWIRKVADKKMRFGANVPQLVMRSLQIAKSSPPGPVYLMGAREVMESDVQPLDLKKIQPAKWKPLARQALADEVFGFFNCLTEGRTNNCGGIGKC
jgi:hypothetical protein